MIVERRLRRKRKTTRITRAIEISSVSLTSWTDARIVAVASCITESFIAGGTAARSSGSRARTPSTVSMMLAPGWRETMMRTAGFPFARPPVKMFSTESVTVATSDRRTRAAVLVVDDQRLILGSLEQLIGCAEGPRALSVRDLTLRPVGIGARKGCANIFQAEPVLVQHRGIDVHADRRQRTASDGDLPNAFNLRELLRQDGRCHVVHSRSIDQIGGQRQQQNRRVGRIDFAVERIGRKICRQLTSSGVDRGLHVAPGRIDVAVEIELKNDRSRAENTAGSHLSDSGNAAELALQRRRDG